MTRARLISLGAIAFVIVACGGGQKKPVTATTTAGSGSVSNRCPDFAKADEVGAFDFANEYQLSRDAADKLKAATLASMEVNNLGEKLDAELGIACAQIAHDLGNKGDWRNGNDACSAAIKAVHDARAKLGPRATAQLVVRPPVCLANASLMTKCASICDSSVPAGKVKAECESKAGRCDGNCDGICEAKAPTKCDGVCTGVCEGTVKGSCGGKCTGQCDGKPSKGGPCMGTCTGTCSQGAISGTCTGSCGGSCKLAKPSICDGTCAGTCSVELADSKCAGEFKMPDVSTDCRARCELEVINKTECSVPQVGFIANGAKDRETAEAMKLAVDKSFPGLLKILFEVGEKGPKRVLNSQAVISGTRTSFKDLARSGGKGTAAASETQLTKCFDDHFKKAEATAATVKQGLDQALAVRDEATK